MPGHISPEYLVRRFVEARRKPKGSRERIGLLEGLVADCPCFAPALVDLALQTQLFDEVEEEGNAQASLAKAGGHLATAVGVSGRSAEALTERAYFLDVIDDRAADAEHLFREAVERAFRDLEDAWVGLIKVCLEQEKLGDAQAELDRAASVLPASDKLRALRDDLANGPT